MKMKKLVLLFAVVAAVSLASCGNKAKDQAAAKADSTRIADSIAAANAAGQAAKSDSTAKDSTKAPAAADSSKTAPAK